MHDGNSHSSLPTTRTLLGKERVYGDSPVASGATVYFVHPTRLFGHTIIVDLERELGVRVTMRASRVVARVLARM